MSNAPINFKQIQHELVQYQYIFDKQVFNSYWPRSQGSGHMIMTAYETHNVASVTDRCDSL